MNNKFTNRLQKVLNRARRLASFSFREEVNAEDVLLSIASERGSIAGEILTKSNVKHGNDIDLLESGNLILKKEEDINLNADVKMIIQDSVRLASVLEHRYVGTEHLLYSLLKSRSEKVQILIKDQNINKRKMTEHLDRVLNTESRFPEINNVGDFDERKLEKLLKQEKDMMKDLSDGYHDISPDSMNRPSMADVFSKVPKKSTSALDLFARELTDEKIQSNIDPVIGRESEIERIIQILSRRTKNNPILLGDPGVGKTAIVEGLGKKILQGQVPDALVGKRIYAVDMNLILAGSVMRGEFEQRLKQVIDEVTSDPNIIIFIDEIHTIVGAGAVGGSMDASNILKPSLSRGEIHCIGATTYEDYKKYIEDDSALERRFQPVSIDEPTIEDTQEILRGLKEYYQTHHRVKITDEAVVAATELSARYIPERFLPDKAIDLIDEACSRFKVKKGISGGMKKIRGLEEKLGKVIDKKIRATSEEDYPAALAYKEEEAKIYNQIELETLKSEKSGEFWIGQIGAEDIAKVVAEMKHIPLGNLKMSEGKKLVVLESKLKKYIIGQDQAMLDICTAIKKSRVGLGSDERPMGSFLFIGPSGVGKTYTAKILAREIFGSSDKLIRFDMSEFMEGFNVSRLIGSPPGYVGFKEGGKLTEAVRRKPHSVVLFDEIDKAHPQVLSLLLQIMEDGHLTDSGGKKVSFKDSLVVMTSNYGTEGVSNLGFEGQKVASKEIGNTTLSLLKEKFNSEFLNRLDKLVVFKHLNKTSLEKIIVLELAGIFHRLKAKGIEAKFDKKLIKYIADEGYSADSGARQIRRLIEEYIEAPLTDMLLLKDLSEGNSLNIGLKNGKVNIQNIKIS